MQPKQNNQSKKIGFIFIGAILLIIVFIVITSLASKPKPESDTTSQTNNAAGNNGTNVAVDQSKIYQDVGPDFSALKVKGFTTEQVDGLQYALYKYAQPAGISVKNTTAVKDSVTQLLPDASKNRPYITYNFTIRFDEQHSSKVSVVAIGVFRMRVYIYNINTNALLYDSQEFDVRNIQ